VLMCGLQDGGNALHCAAQAGNLPLVTVLLDAAADVAAVDKVRVSLCGVIECGIFVTV
jgi:hypothetical protein